MKNTAFSCSVFRLYLFYQHRLEAPPRLELGVELLQSSALPLGYGAVCHILCGCAEGYTL